MTTSVSTLKPTMKDYIELTKPRLASLVMLSSLVGFILATKGSINYPLLTVTIFGTALVSAGSMTLNQWMERMWDGMMKRTAKRPIPSGKVKAEHALIFGMVLSVVGLVILFTQVNLAATVIAFLTTFSYLALYTPMKRKTSLCTLVGAIPGALPPLIGWAAVAGVPSYEAWILFAIIFLWQMPHFLAIAWLHREDFAKAGFKMLSLNDPDGTQVGRQSVLYSAALLPVSLLPTIVGLTGNLYFYSALVMGIFVLVIAIKSAKKMDQMARPLFHTSITYLTILFILMMVDKV